MTTDDLPFGSRRAFQRFLETYEQPAEHRDFWRWLLEQACAQPVEPKLEPLTNLVRPVPDARLAALVTEWYETSPGGEVHLLAAHYQDEREAWSVGGEGEAEVLADLQDRLFRYSNRGRLIVITDGNETLPGLASLLARNLVQSERRIDVIGGGSELKALLIREANCTYKLASDSSAFGSRATPMSGTSIGPSSKVLSGVANPATPHYRNWIERSAIWRTYLASAPQISIGLAGMKALKQVLPAGTEKYRCPRLLEALLRAGHGYRGGYQYATSYRGPAERADLTLAYTAALDRPLPLEYEFGECVDHGYEHPGIYVCTISDAPAYPIACSRWDGDARGVDAAPARGERRTTLLFSAEFAGIRALGCRVEPRLGYRIRDWFSAAAFSRRVVALAREFGRTSVVGRDAKLLANSVVGKLGESSVRQRWQLAADEPPGDWLCALDPRGRLIPDLWESSHWSIRSHQHVDVAAWITASVRGQVYAAMATVNRSHGRVIHAHTDGLVATDGLGEALGCVDWQPGVWRFEGRVTEAKVWSPGRVEFGEPMPPRRAHQPAPELIRRLALGRPLRVASSPNPAAAPGLGASIRPS